MDSSKKMFLTQNFLEDFHFFYNVRTVNLLDSDLSKLHYIMMHWNTFMPIPISFTISDFMGMVSVRLHYESKEFIIECAMSEYHGKMVVFPEFLSWFLTNLPSLPEYSQADITSVEVDSNCVLFSLVDHTTKIDYQISKVDSYFVATMQRELRSGYGKADTANAALQACSRSLLDQLYPADDSVTFSVDASQGELIISVPLTVGLECNVLVGQGGSTYSRIYHGTYDMLIVDPYDCVQTVTSVYTPVDGAPVASGTRIYEYFQAVKKVQCRSYPQFVKPCSPVTTSSVGFHITSDARDVLFPFLTDNSGFRIELNNCGLTLSRVNDQLYLTKESIFGDVDYIRAFLTLYMSHFVPFNFSWFDKSIRAKYLYKSNLNINMSSLTFSNPYSHATILGRQSGNPYFMNGKRDLNHDKLFLCNVISLCNIAGFNFLPYLSHLHICKGRFYMLCTNAVISFPNLRFYQAYDVTFAAWFHNFFKLLQYDGGVFSLGSAHEEFLVDHLFEVSRYERGFELKSVSAQVTRKEVIKTFSKKKRGKRGKW